MARVRSGQAPAWPLPSDRSARRGSGIKRDLACTFTRHFPPVLVVLRSQSRLRLEGGGHVHSAGHPRTLAPPGDPLPLHRLQGSGKEGKELRQRRRGGFLIRVRSPSKASHWGAKCQRTPTRLRRETSVSPARELPYPKRQAAHSSEPVAGPRCSARRRFIPRAEVYREVIQGTGTLCEVYPIRRCGTIKRWPVHERIELPHLIHRTGHHVHHTTGFDREEIIDLCIRINSVQPGAGSPNWPPCLGLFKSVVAALTSRLRR